MSIKTLTRTAAQLTVATGLAAAALTMSTAVTAHAEDGPVIVLPPNTGDPKPMDFDNPTPTPDPQDGPKDKAPVPQPDPQDGPKDKAPKPKPKPTGPGDIAQPEDDQDPTGPGDLTNPQPCPTHGVDCGGDKGGDQPKTEKPHAKKPAARPATKPVIETGPVTPTRVHAGLAGDTQQQEQGGLDLTWLLVGGALVTAGGTAYVVRRKRTAQVTA
ncbi:MAG: hypothetical protein J7518_04875 [Nocardioidaceae bacterium]|nr:hypothetical protein [Nocardioidaceae bacterium]